MKGRCSLGRAAPELGSRRAARGGGWAGVPAGEGVAQCPVAPGWALAPSPRAGPGWSGSGLSRQGTPRPLRRGWLGRAGGGAEPCPAPGGRNPIKGRSQPPPHFPPSLPGPARPVQPRCPLHSAPAPLLRSRLRPEGSRRPRPAAPAPLPLGRADSAHMEVPGGCHRRCLALVLLLASCIGCAATPRRNIPRRQGRTGGSARTGAARPAARCPGRVPRPFPGRAAPRRAARAEVGLPGQSGSCRARQGGSQLLALPCEPCRPRRGKRGCPGDGRDPWSCEVRV